MASHALDWEICFEDVYVEEYKGKGISECEKAFIIFETGAFDLGNPYEAWQACWELKDTTYRVLQKTSFAHINELKKQFKSAIEVIEYYSDSKNPEYSPKSAENDGIYYQGAEARKWLEEYKGE